MFCFFLSRNREAFSSYVIFVVLKRGSIFQKKIFMYIFMVWNFNYPQHGKKRSGEKAVCVTGVSYIVTLYYAKVTDVF